MPVVTLNTNVKDGIPEDLEKELTTKISELIGKPEKFIYVIINSGKRMVRGGTSDPCCVLDIENIGFNEEKCKALNDPLKDFIKAKIGAPPERTFVVYKPLERWQVAL